MSVVAMPPYPNTIPASAFSPAANDDNDWMATPAASEGFTLGQLEVAIVLLVDVIRVSRIGGVRPTLAAHQAATNASHG